MKCKLCSSGQTNLLFISEDIHGRHSLSKEQFGVYKCLNCKVAFTAVEIDSEYYSKYYPKNYYPDIQYFLINKVLSFLQKISFLQRLRLIKQYSPEGNKILEIGCARGEFLHFLPSSFQKYGIEINETGYQYIKEHYKDITIYNVRIDDDSFDNDRYGKYDIIIMWHVFEHVENPLAFMKSLSKLLTKNGVIILEIPNRNSIGFNLTKKAWFHLDTPRHLFYYTYDSMKSLLQKYGFEIVKYSGNFIDYFQDLPISFYMMFKTSNFFLNNIIVALVMPPVFIIRLLTALFIPTISELNTYVIKQRIL